MFSGQYNNRRVLITGHTGFKGSWLTLWLQSIGAKVTGISLPPDSAFAHWNLLSLNVESRLIDIREAAQLRKAVQEADPEIVFHLAAQPLVRRSYLAPLETWSTNVIGTANVLDACRDLPSIKAIVVVTTDKCYENQEWVWGYRENDRLGGHDPYSASKAASELVVSSYRSAFFQAPEGPLLATARAGNVIGGGDWSEDRLIPDLMRAAQAGKPLEIRSPTATRPWHHVLECLSGYLCLGQKLLERNKDCAGGWNFGPDREGNRQVQQVLEQLRQTMHGIEWYAGLQTQLKEARLLHLDSSKARDLLAWHPVWSFEDGVSTTARWYMAWLNSKEVISVHQLNEYVNAAYSQKLSWTIHEPK